MVVSVWLFLILHPLSGQEVAMHRWPVKILQRLVVPFRSNLFSQSSVSPCGFGLSTCFSSAAAVPSRMEFELKLAADSYHPIMLELRTDHRGPLGHHWLEFDSLEGNDGRFWAGHSAIYRLRTGLAAGSLRKHQKDLGYASVTVAFLASDQLPIRAKSGGGAHNRETNSANDGSIRGFDPQAAAPEVCRSLHSNLS
jgi:hypothetical protein